MAQWSKQKAESANINGGNEYAVGDVVSREQLNAITNNSFYASDKADNAVATANSANQTAQNALAQVTEKQGTIVKVNGVAQNEISVKSDIQTQIDDTNSALTALKTNAVGISDSAWVGQLLTGAVGYGDKIVAKNIAQVGFIKYASGLIIKWGYTANAQNVVVTMDSAENPFTSASSYQVIVGTGHTAITNYGASAEIISNNSFKLYMSDANRRVNYIAIGY